MADVTTNPVTVLLVDDEPLVRTGLAMILGGDARIRVLGEAGDGREAIAMVEEHRPDVVLMDIRMPRMDGLEATRTLCARSEAPQVIVLTTFNADEYVLQALAAGASGFLLKDTPPAAIIEAVQRVAAGDPMLSPQVTRQLMGQIVAQAPSAGAALARDQVAELTEREREVAVGVGRGLSNADIAAELYMSVATVKAHLSRVMSKFDATNRTQVAIRVHDAGLV